MCADGAVGEIVAAGVGFVVTPAVEVGEEFGDEVVVEGCGL